MVEESAAGTIGEVEAPQAEGEGAEEAAGASEKPEAA